MLLDINANKQGGVLYVSLARAHQNQNEQDAVKRTGRFKPPANSQTYFTILLCKLFSMFCCVRVVPELDEQGTIKSPVTFLLPYFLVFFCCLLAA